VTTEPFGQLDLVAIGAGLLAQNGVPPALIPGLADTAANPLLPLQALQFIFPFINVPNVVEDGRTADNDLAYNVRAAYKFTDNISGYVTYATGFKASSFNLSRDAAPLPRDYIPGSPITNPAPSAIRTAGLAAPNTRTGTRFAGPEEASVYELGLKGQFDTFAFNFAVFQQAIENFQGSIFNGTGFILQNAPKQSTFGLELDTSFTPIRALNLTASLTYLNPKFDSFPDASAFGPDLTVVQADLTGLRPAGIPEFALAVGGTYTASLTDKVNAIFHADFTHESKVAVAQGLSVANITREVNLLNASVTLALDNGLEVSIWGRNLSDSRFLAAIFPGVAQPGNINGYPSLPRTYGGLVRYRF
jgi:outer membrane receptor protein involved in Fe transport